MTKFCLCCGAPFRCTPSRAERARYCSRSCRSTHVNEAHDGKHAAWGRAGNAARRTRRGNPHGTTHLAPATRRRILAAVGAGLPQREVAREFGVAPSTVSRIRRAA